MIERRKPLARNPKPLKRSPVRKRRPGPPRRGPADIPAERWRNPAYLRFLRAEGKCRACEVEHPKWRWQGGLDPMHGPPNGRSQKGPDAEAIPGCRAHHREQAKIGWIAFESKYGFSRAAEALVWWTAFVIWREHERG